MSDKNYEFKKTENNEDFQVDLEVKVKPELFDKERSAAYNRLAPNVRLKGFRAGKAPKQMIEASLGGDLIEEALNSMLPRITAEILNDEALEPITQVDYKITKVDGKEGIEYTASFTKFPSFKLTDVTKLKTKKDEVTVTPEDLEKVKKNMFEDSMKDKEIKDKDFKEVNDDWVAALKMDNISTVKELDEQIEKTIKGQREILADDKYVLDLIKEIATESKVKLPTKIFDKEVELQEQEYKKRVEGLGLKFDDFVRNQKINLDEMKANWRKEVTNNFERDVVLMQIIKDMKLAVSDEEVEKEISSIQDPKLKQQYDSARGRMNIRTIMLRQKAVSWIRDQVKK